MMRFVEIFMTAAAASVRTCLFKNKINQFHFQNGKFEEVEFFGAREIHFDLTNLHFEDASRHGTIKMEIWHPNEMNELQNIRNLQMIYFCIEILFFIFDILPFDLTHLCSFIYPVRLRYWRGGG